MNRVREVLYFSKEDKPPTELNDQVKLLCALDIDTDALPLSLSEHIPARGRKRAHRKFNSDLGMGG